MVKSKKDSHTSSAFSKETLDLFKNLTFEGLDHDLVTALQNGLCDNLNRLDKLEIGLEQISVIKNVGKQLNSRKDENANEGNFILEALVFLFVKCKAKHAVRQTIASIFQGLQEHLKAAAISELNKSLKREFRDLERELFASEKIAVDRFNDLYNNGINIIIAFMENFPLGKVAIHESRNDVLSFLNNGLTREMSRLSVAASLDARTTSMMNCLSTLKSTIAVLHCCKSNGQQQMELNHNKTTEILLEMLKNCLHITQSSDYLLDCRNAAGVATISILQSLLPKDSLGSAITRLLVSDSSRVFNECRTDSGNHPMQDSVDTSSDSSSGKPKSAACVKDGPKLTAESIVSNDSEIKDRLEETIESIVPSVSCSGKLERTTCVKDESSLTAESFVSDDSVIKPRLGESVESSNLGYCEEKQELATKSIEERVLSIVDDVYRDGGHCMVSRLVIAHGVVTKLDSDVLHGGMNSEGILADEKNGLENLCVRSELSLESSQGALSGGVFSSTLLDTLLSICSTVNEKGTTVFAFKALFCWTVEAFNHCKKLKNSGNLTHLKSYSPHNCITPKIIQTLNNYLDHPIDAVRHQVRNSLENVIRIINLFPDSDNLVLDLLEHWVKGSLRVRSNCMALCCIINYVKISDILRIRSSFPLDLIDCLDDANLVSHICDLYIKSANKHRSEITDFQSNYSGWISIWCQPVFDVLSSVDKARRSAVVDYLVPGLLIGFPNLIRFILDRSKDCESAKDYTITSVVFLARARRLKECAKLKLDAENTDDSDLWHGLIKVASLRQCLCHFDDQVRIDALSLICESNKTTESFSNQDFQLLKFFIPLNMTNQNPLFRHQFVCSLKKAFCRMTERSKNILKRINDLKASKVRDDREMNEIIEKGLNEISMYENFARWLLQFLLDGLHPASSFPRINTALEIILVFLKILNLSKDSQTCFTNLLSAKDVFTKLGIRTLIGCFHDSFDMNRILANEILSLLPRDLFTFDEDEILCMVKETLSMAESSQADDTNAAPYFIKLFTSGNLAKMVENALINGFVECKELDKDMGCRYTLQLMIGTVLLKMLQEQIRIAEINLLDAAMNAPLHGTLYCLRQLLSTVVLTSVKKPGNWKIFVNNLIDMCFKVNHITGPIISSNAPEGHVISESADHSNSSEGHVISESADHNVLASHVVDDLSGNSTQSAKSKVETQAYRSQLLLACCWRSMKEVVLILGEIASNAPIDETTLPEDNSQNLTRNIAVFNEDISQPLSDLSIRDANEASLVDSTGFITPNTVIRIGDLFINILLSSRHIGAFELAYPGFVKVCSMLWKSEIPQLKVLPNKWIEDLLSDLQSCKSTKTFCATRRSAGIPFYISAICSTEPGIPRRKTFKQVMKVLMEICQDAAFFKENSENEIEKTKKVIGLNILRAMFKDTKFGEDVFSYVSDGFVIAINGFSSEIWAIRNACTLLFSALMSRVFGLKKIVMSGTEFFSRFSPLYQFLVNEMKRITGESSHERNQLQLHPSVFPVLYLLSHLYPSSLDGNASDMNLSSFIPFINSCGDSNVYKIRAMAADALASLVTPSQLTDILNEIISSMLTLKASEPLNNNRINGCLMKIKALLRGKSTNTAVSSSLREEIIKGPLVKLSKLSWILDRSHLCSLNKALLLEIINENVFGITIEEENRLSQHHMASLSTLKTQCLACCLQELGIISHPSQIPGDEAGKFQLKMIGYDLFRKQCIMVVKNFLDNPKHLSVIGECLSSELQPLPLLQLYENEDHDMRLSLLSLLENSDNLISQNEAVVTMLQRRLLEENDVDCAAGICRVLSKQADKIKFPWMLAKDGTYPCEEIWRVLKTKFGKSLKREIVRTSLLRFCVVFVSHFIQQINIPETPDLHQKTMLRCLEEIFNFIMDSCKPEENFPCRKIAAEIIASEEYLEIVKSAKDKLSPLITVAFDYWRCVTNLLQDEDTEIRSLIARKIFPFLKECNIEETHALFSDVPADYFMHPGLVLEITIKVITQIYSPLYPREVLEFLFTLVVGKSASELGILLKETSKKYSLQGYFDLEESKNLEEIELELLPGLGPGGNVSKIRNFESDSSVCDQERMFNGELESDVDKARPVENIGLSGKETVSSGSQGTIETMGIFEQGNSNIYMETITLGHIAFTELQNLLTLQTNSSTAINRNFVVFIWSNLKEWIVNPKLFYGREYFVNSCQILMGIYILFCLDDVVIKNSFKKGLEMFFSRLDASNFEDNVSYSALYNHLRNIRILCEF